jgi:hypothetical protein
MSKRFVKTFNNTKILSVKEKVAISMASIGEILRDDINDIEGALSIYSKLKNKFKNSDSIKIQCMHLSALFAIFHILCKKENYEDALKICAEFIDVYNNGIY